MTKDSDSMLERYGPSNPLARRFCCGLILLLILCGVIALILYLVYRPFKPQFSVLNAAVFQLSNATSASPATAVSTSMQFTISIRNPNDRATIHYDRLSAYVLYRDQAITPPVDLPPLFQEEDSTVAVSPVLGGQVVPVSAEVAAGLMTDENYGVLGMRLVMLGRLKYKSGPFKSQWYGLYVRCDLLLGIKKGVAGQVPLLGGNPDCDTSI